MSKRTRSSRKRRTAAARQDGAAGVAVQDAAADRPTAARKRAAADRRAARTSKRRPSGGGAPIAVTPTYGERPRPAWHPLPLAELLILAGVVAVVVAFQQGVTSNTATMLVGIAAVAIGTLEVTIREHRSGFRSHTTLLAVLPVLIFHSVTILLVSIFTSASRYVNLGLFAVDLLLFVVIFRALRSNFLTARTRASGRS